MLYLWLGLGLLLLAIAAFLLIYISPGPLLHFMQRTIFKIPEDARPSCYIDRQVKVTVSLPYVSDRPGNTYDLYLPPHALAQAPTVLWVHGGGYIGGDKLEVRPYATALAASGYTVVVMNYALAPQSQYPAPVRQVGDCLRTLAAQPQRPQLNLQNLFLAGDSAGAQIVCQFIEAQQDPQYAALLGLETVAISYRLQGVLLYCGPYKMKAAASLAASGPAAWLFRAIGWAYEGQRNWLQGERVGSTEVENFLTPDFPPTYITDGNWFSFEAHARSLAKRLQDLQVPVVTRFFDRRRHKALHEFQFQLDSEPARLTWTDTLNFLNRFRRPAAAPAGCPTLT
ncbi:MAG: alpha/beta hydrolase [Oscillospiraceae bacterium]|nr:alpha/beta hydrolase [Oscillospiraceae bacterium]MDD4367813.1 alpha/beta hydrolase [Oscillospiraceae bacterium]